MAVAFIPPLSSALKEVAPFKIVLMNSCCLISVTDYFWAWPKELLSLRLFVQMTLHLIYILYTLRNLKKLCDIDSNSQLWSLEYVWKMFRLIPFNIFMLAAHFNYHFEKLSVKCWPRKKPLKKSFIMDFWQS